MYASSNRIYNKRWLAADYVTNAELGMYAPYAVSKRGRVERSIAYDIEPGLGSILDTIKNIGGQLISVIVPHPVTQQPTAVNVPVAAPQATGMSAADIGRAILQGAVTGGARVVAGSQYGAQAVQDIATQQTAKYATGAMIAVAAVAGFFLLSKRGGR